MYTYQQRLEYAKRLQRLQQAVVIKDNIHLTYKYKNRNKAYAHIDSVQDRINKAIIEDVVNGNADSIKNLEKQGENLITDTLTNERKRLHQDKNHKAINQATKSNSNYFSNIFNYRRKKIGESLEDKINKELKKKSVVDLSDKEQIQHLQSKFKGHGSQRLKNILTDAMHTNESNIGFIKAVEDGFNYKIWKNGRVAKGRTRAWHKEKHIQAVPIDETFDIYGSYPARMMYPGDLNGGAENVANCKCWLLYTNRIPSNLRKKTVFNVAPTFQQIWDKSLNSKEKIVPNSLKKLNKTKADNFSIIPFQPKIKSIIPKIKNKVYLKKERILNEIHENNRFKVKRSNNNVSLTHEGITIIKPKNTKYLFLREIEHKLNALPKSLKKYVEKIELSSSQYEYNKKIVGMVFHDNPQIVHLYNTSSSKEGYKSALVHELAHVLDHNYNGRLYGISNSMGKGSWREAFNKDKIYNIKQGNFEFDGFVSDYAEKEYHKHVSKNPAFSEKEHSGRFAEDFADSIELYFQNPRKFKDKFPNRGKFIEQLLGVKNGI